jgi:hypothetical protein
MVKNSTPQTEETKPLQITDIRALYTKQREEDGIDLEIFTPTGELTDGRVRICGVESKTYKARNAELMRAYGDLDPSHPPEGMTEAEVQAKIEARDLDLACALVIGWNIPLEFNPANVRDVLDNIPALRKRIVTYGVRRDLFFAKTPPASETGQGTS